MNPNDVYEFREVIGTGRYGTANRVFSRQYNQDFCMKVMKKGCTDSNSLRQMYVSETQLLRKICHPNVIRLYDYFETPETYNIVLEFCEGGTLAQLLQKEKTISIPKLQSWFRQLFSAFDQFSSSGVAHRDIKPSNIVFYGEEKRPKFIDWGFCTIVKPGELCTAYCGTFPYAAPEILRKQAYDPIKSDIWSMGVVLYECAFGVDPFKREYQTESIELACKGQFTFPEGTRPILSDLISGLLKVNPNERLTPSEILLHPFFQFKPSNALSKSLSNPIQSVFHTKSSTLVETYLLFGKHHRHSKRSNMSCDWNKVPASALARKRSSTQIHSATPPKN